MILIEHSQQLGLTNAVSWFNNNIATIEQKLSSFGFNPNDYSNFLLEYSSPFYNIQFFNIDNEVFYQCSNDARISFRKGSNQYAQPDKYLNYRYSTGSWGSSIQNYYAGGVVTGLMDQKPENNYYGNVVIETL